MLKEWEKKNCRLLLIRLCPHLLLLKRSYPWRFNYPQPTGLTYHGSLFNLSLLFPSPSSASVFVSSTVPKQCLSFRVLVIDSVPKTINSAGLGTISRPAEFWTLHQLKAFTGLWSYQHPGVTWEWICVWIEAQSFWQDQCQSMLRPGHQMNCFTSENEPFLTSIGSYSSP